MVIFEDTRQQADKHKIKHAAWNAAGDVIIRTKLAFGDYSLPPRLAVDTKASMAEIAQNIGGTREEHNRFRNEVKGAQAAGVRLVVLIENTDGVRCLEDVASWVNPRLAISPKAIRGPQLAKAMQTMSARYGVSFQFCTPEEAPARIKEILLHG